jgi:Uncharacterized protein conserved in bacteria (DUF2272)
MMHLSTALTTLVAITYGIVTVSAGFETDIVLKATTEYNVYKNQDECSSFNLKLRIAQYWENLGVTNRDGCTEPRDNFPWSAAFISFMVRQAGGGNRFAYSQNHHTYVRDAFNGGSGLYNSAVDISGATPQIGDLACVGRSSAADWTFAQFKTWASDPSSGGLTMHCDVIVETNSTGNIVTIGGNLMDMVQRNKVPKGNYKILLQVTREASTSDRLVDIGVVVDVSGSFDDDLANFRDEVGAIVSLVTAVYPQTRFGLATFQDYPLNDWGDSTDIPHSLIKDIGPSGAFIAGVNAISAAGGGDTPEGQLVSLYQSITGKGQVVPSSLDGGYTIPAGLNFNFRPGSARIILLWTDASFHEPSNTPAYPGPSLVDVINAASFLNARRLQGNLGDQHRALQVDLNGDAIRIIGIVSLSRPLLALPTVFLNSYNCFFCLTRFLLFLHRAFLKFLRLQMLPVQWPGTKELTVMVMGNLTSWLVNQSFARWALDLHRRLSKSWRLSFLKSRTVNVSVDH